MHVVHFLTKNYLKVNGKRKENQLLQFPFVCEMMLASFFLVHGQYKRDLGHLKLTFDLVVKLLPVAIELHDALRLLFQPELIELIRQVTVELVEVLHPGFSRYCVIEMKLQSVILH